MISTVAEVALPIPKRMTYEYLVPDDFSVSQGYRVLVPFAGRKLIGVVMSVKSDSQWPIEKLKVVESVLDESSIFDDNMMALLLWANQYYHHPIGEILHTALPVHLRKGKPSIPQAVNYWQLSLLGQKTDLDSFSKNAIKQKQLLTTLQSGKRQNQHLKQEFSTNVIKALVDKQLIEEIEAQPTVHTNWASDIVISQKPQANIEQSLAISAILQRSNEFNVSLIEGVTGSGKTEVYLQCIEPILKAGKQVLILVPEIGLTPQTVLRFKQRFGVDVGLLHSNLNDNDRLNVWLQSKAGALPIIIGTRSAIFTPMAQPGMIIVDEEHDNSFKQQDGFRYHARDLAVIRSRLEGIPLILGSATPSLESLNNALNKKYCHFMLQQRAGNASNARHSLLDIKSQQLQFGLAQGMLDRIKQHLQQDNQVMIFLNRRGYSPAVMCHQCGFIEQCGRCDKSYTLHMQLNKMQCHHCGGARPIPKRCKHCDAEEMTSFGVGTEQLEQGLAGLFPDYKTVRIDSDTIRGKSRFNQILTDINNRHYQILIGTQILAKGHHFPDVTLVVILDVDGALFSADYRASENLAQLVTQVAGRAGRASKSGEMWLQTHHPEHPLLQDLLNNGYDHFARFALQERKHALLPPSSYQALFRAEAHNANQAHRFLQEIAQLMSPFDNLSCVGPLPALMEKRQGRYRMQLLLQCQQRGPLQQALFTMLPKIENLPEANKLRWSLDVDPQDFS